MSEKGGVSDCHPRFRAGTTKYQKQPHAKESMAGMMPYTFCKRHLTRRANHRQHAIIVHRIGDSASALPPNPEEPAEAGVSKDGRRRDPGLMVLPAMRSIVRRRAFRAPHHEGLVV
jgi:hypothetical protein